MTGRQMTLRAQRDAPVEALEKPATQTLYKVTRPDRMTSSGFIWEPGRWYNFPGTGELYGNGWAHFYLSPQLAVLLDPIHAAYQPFALWRAEGVVGKRDHDIKVGCARARILEEISVPEISDEARVWFAVTCVMTAYHNPDFVRWAKNWLSSADRTHVVAAAWRKREWTPAAKAAAEAAEAAADTSATAWRKEQWTVAVKAAKAAKAAAEAAALGRQASFDLMKIASVALLPWEP